MPNYACGKLLLLVLSFLSCFWENIFKNFVTKLKFQVGNVSKQQFVDVNTSYDLSWPMNFFRKRYSPNNSNENLTNIGWDQKPILSANDS